MNNIDTNVTEKKNERISVAIAITVHCALLIGIIFLGAFKAPNPPLGSGDPGVELNFGLDDAGSGNIQTEAPANDNTAIEDAKPGEQASEATVAEELPKEEPAEVKESPAPEDKQNVVTTTDESPVAVNEEKKPEAKPKAEAKPKEEIKKEEPKKEEPKINTTALYKKPGANGKNGTSNETPGNNNGDRPGAVGDQGNPNGTLEAKALYGTPGNGGTGGGPGGSGGGPTLNLPGWTWDTKPDKKDPSSETGYVVFEFTVDENGDIVPPVKKVAGNLSPTVDNFYRNQLLEASTFRQLNSKVRATSTKGTVRFNITAR